MNEQFKNLIPVYHNSDGECNGIAFYFKRKPDSKGHLDPEDLILINGASLAPRSPMLPIPCGTCGVWLWDGIEGLGRCLFYSKDKND